MAFCSVLVVYVLAGQAQTSPGIEYQYPFQDPSLPIERRVDDIVSPLTLDEKIQCLSTDPSVPRLGIKGTGHVRAA